MNFLRKLGVSEWICILAIGATAAMWVRDYLPASEEAVNGLIALAERNEDAISKVDCYLGENPSPNNGELRALRKEVAALLLQDTVRRNESLGQVERERTRLYSASFWSLSGEDMLKIVLLKVTDNVKMVIGCVFVIVASVIWKYRRRRQGRRTIFL